MSAGRYLSQVNIKCGSSFRIICYVNHKIEVKGCSCCPTERKIVLVIILRQEILNEWLKAQISGTLVIPQDKFTKSDWQRLIPSNCVFYAGLPKKCLCTVLTNQPESGANIITLIMTEVETGK